MPNLRPVLFIIGVLISILAVAMVIPAAVDLYAQNPDWKAFLSATFFTLFVGIGLILSNQEKIENISLRQTFILTTFSWIALVMFAALPFAFSDQGMNYTDAFFEAMSGLTTTGATVITGLDEAPPGILLWRAILQWMGGVGIIVMAMAILPMLRIGGMQLFRSESSDKSDKILPRATQISGAIGGIYLVLTMICAFALWSAGLDLFDAICHAMTTIATSGFSTHDASIGHFNNPQVETIIIIGMIMSGIPFVLYIQMVGGRYNAVFRDAQVKWFITILVTAVLFTTYWLHLQNIPLQTAFRMAAFNVTSIITTTGFSSNDYSAWGGFIITFIFILSVVGGCTGSTTGGIKIFRYQVLFEIAKSQINRLIQPHGIFTPQFNKKPINDTVTSSVLSFFILFAFSFSVLAILLSLTGLDYLTSMSASAAMLANVGPGLGEIIGPSGNYSTLSDTAKWLLAFGMLVGRLEIFTVLVLFSSYFWKS